MTENISRDLHNAVSIGTTLETQTPHFSDTIAALVATHESGQSLVPQTMDRMGQLAVEFAEAMIQNSMPTSIVIEKLHEPDPDEPDYLEGPLIAIVRHPAWIVLEDQDLTGASMTSAMVGHERFSRSLGSGTPNNFRTDWETIDPHTVDKYPFDYDDTLRYQANAVAVDGLGRLILATRFYAGRGKEFWSGLSLAYNLLGDGTVKPERFMNIDGLTAKNADKQVNAMRRKLDEAAKKYAERRLGENESETAERGLEYYWPATEPVVDPEEKKRKYIKTRLIRRLRKLL